MSDTLLRAIARDAGIQICAASTTELVERAHEIHNTTPLATAALGRTLTATAIMGSQLKVEDGSVTVQIKGNGRSARSSASVIRMAMCAAICRTRLSICRCVRTAS